MLKMNTSRNWLSFPSKIRYFQAYLKSSVPGPSNKAELDQTALEETHRDLVLSSDTEMDKIRARGFSKTNYVYKPPNNVAEIIRGAAIKNGLQLDANDWLSTTLSDLGLLETVGEYTKHFVPNSQLHKIESLHSLNEFYIKPINTITKYQEMARNDSLPKNVAIRENPLRFNPNDKNQLHGGITAYPGSGGQVYGIRNKRLYRQYRPKKEWFEFEDQTFDHEDMSKDMPWDWEIAKKMDRCTDRRFLVNKVQKI